MKPEELEEITQLIEKYVPSIKNIIPILEEIGREALPLFENLTDIMVDLQLRALRRYKKAGINHDDAMKLVLSHKIALYDAVKHNK